MYIKAPYIYYDKNILYPVLKDEGARTGSITIDTPKKLTIDFNCLGVEVRSSLVLFIEIPYYKTVKVIIEKECSKEGLLDRLAEKVVAEEERFGILKILGMCLAVLFIFYLGITCYNLSKGKKLAQAVPCGGRLFAYCTGSDLTSDEVIAAPTETNNPGNNLSELGVLFCLINRNCQEMISLK